MGKNLWADIVFSFNNNVTEISKEMFDRLDKKTNKQTAINNYTIEIQMVLNIV